MKNDMHQRLQNRLRELEEEYQKGQEELQKLEANAANIRNTLLRISGAIQVLKEELAVEAETVGKSEENGIKKMAEPSKKD